MASFFLFFLKIIQKMKGLYRGKFAPKLRNYKISRIYARRKIAKIYGQHKLYDATRLTNIIKNDDKKALERAIKRAQGQMRKAHKRFTQ